MATATIKPGLLVSLKSSVQGGVHYEREDMEPRRRDAGKTVARWRTTRTIEDADEYERAQKARSAARTEIAKICSSTSFGLLLPAACESALDEAMVRARAIADDHNATAVHTRVSVYVLRGRIASTDEEAARAIADEVQGLVREMNGAIDRLDVDAIRAAAASARESVVLLGDEQAELVSAAIKQARSAARAIVQRVQKDGEAAAVVLADVQRGALERARIAFLDVEERGPEEEIAPAMPAAQVQRFGELEVA
jgi:hypothetical protein